jgi:glycosyltransferase involved in cell wall biosynthesis
MLSENLIIINNEKVYEENGSFFCENLDLKVLPEELNRYHKVKYIVRNSKKKNYQKINLDNIDISSNIVKFLYKIYKSFKNKNSSYLLISITPYTFLSFIFLYCFQKKIFIYLFSNGYEEYKHIFGKWSIWIYHIMYKIITSNSEVIVCHERLSNQKHKHIVYISRLDEEWLSNQKIASLEKVKLLYVGRISPEKGIEDFFNIFKGLELEAELSVVGNLEKLEKKITNVNFYGYVSDSKTLIDIYDDHNITILPSYTEATPYVLDESLARLRPVIIFEDIKYIKRDKEGVFISKRDINSFSQLANYIMNNYSSIQKSMNKNKLPTKNSMIQQLSNIIRD